ncbi:MAG: type II toxin-antitoxin system RelE/ParE family toxin [Bacteroidetes bacterium]|nr:type II toxin-antitoxin system RelE/ParE family toxin [Bacteroidota bacterium]
MIFEVVFTQKANDTFDAIRSQIAVRWGDSAVRKFEERTIRVLEMLSKYPLVYQSIEFDKKIRKAHIHKKLLSIL